MAAPEKNPVCLECKHNFPQLYNECESACTLLVRWYALLSEDSVRDVAIDSLRTLNKEREKIRDD